MRTGRRDNSVVLRPLLVTLTLLASLVAVQPAALAQPTPTIAGDLTCDNVFGHDFAANGLVDITVKDAPAGNVAFAGSAPTDGTGHFDRNCDLDGVDLVPGMEITVTDGVATKVLELVGITIDDVDLTTDVVSGTAPADAPVNVSVHQGSDSAELGVVADTSGNWTADFAGTFDIDGGTGVNADTADGDGDSTFVEVRGRSIHAHLHPDRGVGGNHFTPDDSVTVEIFEAPGGTLLFGPQSFPTDGQGTFFVEPHEHGVPLAPGNVVTATDDAAPITKELVLVTLSIDAVDYDLDTVSGTADPGADVFVQVSAGANLQVTADGSGSWTADFGAEGVDITVSDSIHSFVADTDGDATHANVSPPTFRAFADDHNLDGFGFTADDSVTVQIFDAPGGSSLFGPQSFPTDEHGNFFVAPDAHGVSLDPGYFLTATDDTRAITKELTLVAVTFDPLDADTDTASGTAPPNAEVFVDVFGHEGGSGASLAVTADGDGNWVADFGAEGFDVTGNMGGVAQVNDDDGDGSAASSSVPVPPAFQAFLNSGQKIAGFNFTPDDSVTVEILDAPGGTSLFGPAPAPTDEGGSFEVAGEEHGVDIVPGTFVSVTDDTSGVTKELTLVNVTWDSTDFDADTVSGTAPANADVSVVVFDPDEEDAQSELTVTADGDGNWVADFGAESFDITAGSRGFAEVFDTDGDASAADAPEPPHIRIAFGHQFYGCCDIAFAFAIVANGSGFTPDSPVTVELYDAPEGTLLSSDTVTTDGEGSFGCGCGPPFDQLAVPGTHVVVTDPATGIVKDITLAQVTFDVLDPGTDTGSGTAPPDAEIQLEVFSSGEFFFLQTVADQDGNWSIDFAAEGIDIVPHAHATALIYESDGDSSGASTFPLLIDARLTRDIVRAAPLTPNSSVEVSILDGPGGASLYDDDTIATDASGLLHLTADVHGVDLVAGMHVEVTDTDAAITKALTLAPMSITVDALADTASGTAPPDSTFGVGFQFEEGVTGVEAVADGDGNWFVQLDSDIHLDWTGYASIPDDDGDLTFAQDAVSAESAIQNLMDAVSALVDDGKLASKDAAKLLDMLQKARDSLQQSDTAGAVKQLEKFVKEVESLAKWGKIAADDGNRLIDGANEILAHLQGLPLRRDGILISDSGGVLHFLSRRTGRVTEFHHFAQPGNFDIQYLSPTEIVVANLEQSRIEQLNLGTRELTTLAEGAPLENPIGVALGPDGVYYIADHDGAVFAYDVVTDTVNLLADQGPEGEGFASPDGIVVDDKGRVVFTDHAGRIYRITPSTGSIELLATIPDAALNGVVLDSKGNLIVAAHDASGPGSAGAVYRVSSTNGAVTTLFEGGVLRDPEDVAVDGNGNIYVLDSDFQGAFGDRNPAVYVLPGGSGPPETLAAAADGDPLTGDLVDLLLT